MDVAHFEKMLRSQDLYNGRILRLSQDTVELENGRTAQREVVHHHGGAGIVAMDADGTIYMIRQFRYAFGQELLEIPAGKLEAGEEPLPAARRELQEECGLTADSWEDLHPVYPSVGYDTEVIHLYLATGLHRAEAHPDDDEFLTVERWSLNDLVDDILAGKIRDAKTAAAILKVFARQSR